MASVSTLSAAFHCEENHKRTVSDFYDRNCGFVITLAVESTPYCGLCKQHYFMENHSCVNCFQLVIWDRRKPNVIAKVTVMRTAMQMITGKMNKPPRFAENDVIEFHEDYTASRLMGPIVHPEQIYGIAVM
ncbi:hypothetical protein KIN20_020098 [Parelaphostrongylus tenuis]|uniref:Uncharacterized protein n=1 Tax=Parelaphostrongylus tenuis TaxID=148309 RepID=A0AAD5MM35_PARTN|nr:hypothetical protein KIN20_020098 [Parelaphostrongylus tenuis]